MTETLHQVIDQALERAAASVDEIAREIGVTYNTLYAWRTGRRTPTPENLARLADALERRGSELAKLADQLRKEATDG